MGSYVFRWEKPGAHNVFVTGDFDNWSKSIELKKENGIFERQVDLPLSDDVIHFKFVVDGSWVIDESLPTDKDSSGNTNNVLRASDIHPIPAGGRSHASTHDAPTPASAAVSGAALGGAAAAGAGALAATSVPGAFPETPGVNGTSITPPLNIYPGDEVPDYSTYNAATASPRSRIHSSEMHAKDPQEKEQTFSVNPLPATAGTGNPIKVAPGDPLPKPSEYTSNTVGSNVTLDKESYEKSDRYPAGGAPVGAGKSWDGQFGLAPYMHGPHVEGANQPKTMTGEIAGGLAAAASAVGLGSIAGAFASSAGSNTTTSQLAGQQPIEPRGGNDPTIKSAAGENTSTAQLASQVPLEPRGVPQAVSDSQHVANASPEASSNAGALADKEKLEQELKAKVPEEPATSEDNISKKAVAGAAAGTAAVGAGVAAVSSNLPSSIQNAISNMNLTSDKNASVNAGAAPAHTASGVPQEVQDSLQKAHESPEAAANPSAVAEKAQVEAELQSHVPKTNEAADATPASSAALSAVGPAAGSSGQSAGPTIADENTIAAITMANGSVPPASDSGVSSSVVTSAPGNANAATAAAREAESNAAASPSTGLNASAQQPAQSIATEAKQLSSQPETPSKGGLGVADAAVAKAEGRSDSRDVSPMSRPTQPAVTTGVNTTQTPVKSTGGDAVVSGGSPSTPAGASSVGQSSTTSTGEGKTDKKDKRRSLFGRIKDKLKN